LTTFLSQKSLIAAEASEQQLKKILMLFHFTNFPRESQVYGLEGLPRSSFGLTSKTRKKILDFGSATKKSFSIKKKWV